MATITTGINANSGSCQLAPGHFPPFNSATSTFTSDVCADSFRAGVGHSTSMPLGMHVAIVSNRIASRHSQVKCLNDCDCSFVETEVVACNNEKLLGWNSRWSGAACTLTCTTLEEKKATPCVWVGGSTNSNCQDISCVPGWGDNDLPFTIPIIDRPRLSGKRMVQFDIDLVEMSTGFSSVVNEDYCNQRASNSWRDLLWITESPEDKKRNADIGPENWRLPEDAGMYEEWIIERELLVDAGPIRYLDIESFYSSPDAIISLFVDSESLYFADYFKSRKVGEYHCLHRAVLEFRTQILCKEVVSARQGKLMLNGPDVEYTTDTEQSLDTPRGRVGHVKCRQCTKVSGGTAETRSCGVAGAVRRSKILNTIVEVVYQDEVMYTGNEGLPLSGLASRLQEIVVQCPAKSKLDMPPQTEKAPCEDSESSVSRAAPLLECIKERFFVEFTGEAGRTFLAGQFNQKGVKNPNDTEGCEKVKCGANETLDNGQPLPDRRMGAKKLFGSQCQKERSFTDANEKYNPVSCGKPESRGDKHSEEEVEGNCNDGFIVSGASFGETTRTLTCLFEGNLSSLESCADIEHYRNNLWGSNRMASRTPRGCACSVRSLDGYHCSLFEIEGPGTGEDLLRRSGPWGGDACTSTCTALLLKEEEVEEEEEAKCRRVTPCVCVMKSPKGNCQDIPSAPGWRDNVIPATIRTIDRPWLSAPSTNIIGQLIAVLLDNFNRGASNCWLDLSRTRKST